MFERILAKNCQTFDNFNLEFSMSNHNAHYQSYKNVPAAELIWEFFVLRQLNGPNQPDQTSSQKLWREKNTLFCTTQPCWKINFTGVYVTGNNEHNQWPPSKILVSPEPEGLLRNIGSFILFLLDYHGLSTISGLFAEHKCSRNQF